MNPAGQAFDGSIWVAAGPIVGLVFGSLALTSMGALIIVRAQGQRQAMPVPPQPSGRRKVALRADDRQSAGRKDDFGVEAERAEGELPRREDVLKDVSND